MGELFSSDEGADDDTLNEQVGRAMESVPPASVMRPSSPFDPRPGATSESSAARDHSAFLSQLSHDLRTPLNAIIGFTELLQDGHLDPSSPDYEVALASVARNGRLLLALVDELLTRTEQHVRAGQGDPTALDEEPPE